tara:strand:+ start:2416 stop:2802 length:387 start_codon:yes stop_codon:yes gene_type:complete
MNKKEIAVIAAWVGLAAVMATTASYAKDFSVAGQTLSVGASSDLNYTTGVEDWEWEMTPSAGLSAMGIGLTMSTDIDMLALDEGDIFQGLDFTVDYTVPSTNISLYTEVSTDSDLEFGDIIVGATVSF